MGLAVGCRNSRRFFEAHAGRIGRVSPTGQPLGPGLGSWNMDKRRLFKLVTLLGMPVLALLATELVLSLVGYRTTYEREDPFLGFDSVTPLFELGTGDGASRGPVYRTRTSKLTWFNAQEFAAEKPDDDVRIFAFGGSTTFGRPYDHQTAFPNWLEVLLNATDPGTQYEVINVGGVSYASYRINNLMAEMVGYEPDFFIVYTGHNEFLEERTYSDLLEEPPSVTRLRTFLHRSRTYSAARDAWLGFRERERASAERKFQMSGEVTAILDQSFGLDQYQRDPEKAEAIVRHFRYNLEKMVDVARDHGVGLVFVVPPTNDKDFSPFKSQTCGSLRGESRGQWARYYEVGRTRLDQGDHAGALEAFERARDLDSCHADLRYRMGKALFALERYEEAKRAFAEARALDVAPLRAPPSIQEAVREVARERNVPVVDLVAMLERRSLDRSGHAILGEEDFLDHAHPRVQVHQILAEALVDVFVREGWVEPTKTPEEVPRAALYDSVLATLDSSYYAMRDLNLAKVLGWLGKREEALPFVIRAAEALPEHPEAQYIQGVFYQDEGRFAEAEQAYERAISLDSTFAGAHLALGSVYERTGRLDEAVARYRSAVRFDPEADHGYFALGNALYQKGLAQEAIEAYERALSLNPRHSRAWNNLAAVYITERDYVGAIEALEKTLQLEPENISAYKNLGLSYYNTNRPDRAREMFEKVLELRAEDEFARLWLERLDREATP